MNRYAASIAAILVPAVAVAQASPPSPPPVALTWPEPVQFHSADGKPLTFYWNESSDKYTEICRAPCWAQVPAGRHWISVSTSAGHASHQSILLQPGDIVVGKYEPMTQPRVTGWLVLGGGLTLSSVLLAAASTRGSDDHDSGVSRTTLALVAASTVAITAVISILAISSPAETRLRIRTPAR